MCSCLRLLANSSALQFCQRYPQAWCFVGQVQCPCSPAFALQYLARHERGSSSFLPSFDTFANIARAWFTFPLCPLRSEQRRFDNSNGRGTAGTDSGLFYPSLYLSIKQAPKDNSCFSCTVMKGWQNQKFLPPKLRKINLRKAKIPKTQIWIALPP